MTDDLWRPDFHGETTALAGRYQREGIDSDGIEIIVWVMFYEKQGDGAELIYYANRAFDPDRWRQLERSVTAVGAGRPVVSLTLEDPREQRRRLSYWYEVGGRPTHQRWAAKALQIPALIGGRGDAALIAVSGVCEDGCERADDALEDFFSGFPQVLTRAPVAKHCGAVM